MRKLSPEVHQFIRENVKGRSSAKLAELVNQRFGEHLVTETQIRVYKSNHGLKSGTRRGSKFCPEVLEFLKAHARGRCPSELAKLINERFGPGTMTAAQVGHYLNHHGIETGRHAYTPRPVGTQRLEASGYLRVKVNTRQYTKNWVLKQRLVWEQHHGPVPPGYSVAFLDGNKQNCAIDNLALVSDSETIILNHNGLRFPHAGLTESGILLAKLIHSKNAKRRKKG